MDNRQLIMEKALELFCARGYDAVGVQEIAEQSGITKPTLYYYFGSKQGLMETILEENSRILEEMLENVRIYEDYDVLGHLDYMIRYGKDKEQAYSYLKYAELIDEILKNIIAKGKGLELNMAGLKYGLPYAHPHPDVLKRYRELGGEIITVGADGYCPEHIAWDFDKANGILRACGFTYYTEFKQRKPVFKQLS